MGHTPWACVYFMGSNSLHASDATHHPPVRLAAVARAWVDVTAIEVQVVGGATTVRRGRPIVPVGTAVVN